jgi:hypothetical protein
LDQTNPVIRLCIEGTQAEFAGRPDEARRLYEPAWEERTDDYEACIAAHYVARVQPDPEQRLRWDREALTRAEVVGDDWVKDFFPSLCLSLGHACELAGQPAEAR